jgi:hypothetical protein
MQLWGSFSKTNKGVIWWIQNYFGNLEEINADTQSGWTDGANNLINGGEVFSSATPAEIIVGVETYKCLSFFQPFALDKMTCKKQSSPCKELNHRNQ